MPGKRETKVTEDTCIRMLPYSVVKYISTVLDIDKQWEKFVGKIPKRLTELGNPAADPRYSLLQIRLFENTGRRNDGSPTQAILDDWSTQNTKVKHLIKVLCEAHIYEVADYLAVNVLHGVKVPRNQPPNGACMPLPSPEWEPDKKPKFSKSPNKSNMNIHDTHTKSSENEKLFEKGNHVYSDLSQQNVDSPYNKLEPEVVYNRIPSYESEPSVPLKGSNTPAEVLDQGTDYESENTLQVRKIKDLPMKRDGPVENTECHFNIKQEKINSGAILGEGNTMAGKQDMETDDITVIKSRAKEEAQMLLKGKGIMEPAFKSPEIPYKQKKREPCEVDETNSDIDPKGTSDIYSAIGSQKIDYGLLQSITDDFNTENQSNGGRLIGSGGFGEVFLGVLANGFEVAIKRLKKDDEDSTEMEKQFRTELDSLITYRHENIVRLYGYSVDGLGKCLVYEYLCNGSLEDRLKRINDTPVLSTLVRIKILQGTADGITFLNKQGIIHRDIKSANVLLDENYSPKVGDFATARGGPRGNETRAMSTKVVIGTSVYLAPEAMHFDVSTKLDSYSFGIVILEVITGLPALDPSREDQDIKSHVDGSDIEDVLDASGGDWSQETVDILLKLSDRCTQRAKRRRCNVEDIVSDLHGLKVE